MLCRDTDKSMGVVTEILGPWGAVLGVATGLAWMYKKKKNIEEEKNTLEKEKKEYKDTIEDTRDIIVDLQSAVENGDDKQLSNVLDRLEKAILPKDDQILSKLDRLQTKTD